MRSYHTHNMWGAVDNAGMWGERARTCARATTTEGAPLWTRRPCGIYTTSAQHKTRENEAIITSYGTAATATVAGISSE